MDTGVALLQKKIVKLEGFFADVAQEMKREMGVHRLSFLVAEEGAGRFATVYSTHGASLRFTRDEVQLLKEGERNGIIFPKEVLHKENTAIYDQSLVSVIRRKVHEHAMHAVMLVCLDDTPVCLIVCSDAFNSRTLQKRCERFQEFRPHIAECLSWILFYNQALQRLMKILV